MVESHVSIGIVVIGRNEGERLTVCLESIVGIARKVIYVDSGSTDDSVVIAKKLGVDVVNLDITIPFTAARARNEGYKRLKQIYPDVSFVQFVDGDCEVIEGWLDQAVKYLIQNPEVAIVCGRRRERYPHTSLYNMLCDIEWNTPVGEAKACGGDSLIRTNVFEAVSGFNSDMIAGEEPELCVRIRQKGWKIWRLNLEMTLHDANITHFSQWWKRNVRAGYAYALGASMHGAKPERHKVNETRRTMIWGFYIPLMFIILMVKNILFVFMFVVYPLQVIRIALTKRNTISFNWKYAFFITLGKFPEFQGQMKFYLNKLFKLSNEIIEYKN